jgi:hypothetical protein
MIMKKIFLLFYAIFFFTCSLSTQEVYPTHWWVGMKNNKLQLLFRSTEPGINLYVDKIVAKSSSPDLKIVRINKLENRHYLSLDVEIAANAKPQTVEISFGGIIAANKMVSQE